MAKNKKKLGGIAKAAADIAGTRGCPDVVKPLLVALAGTQGKRDEPKPIVLVWTLMDSKKAIKRGWDLFTGDRFEICKHDDSGKLPTDDHALMTVFRGALRGDKLCIKAIMIAGILDPQSLGADFTGLRDGGLLRVIDIDDKPRSEKPYSSVTRRPLG
jgi:hypothetical protein